METRKYQFSIWMFTLILALWSLWTHKASAIYYGEVPPLDSPAAYNTVSVYFTDTQMSLKGVCSGAIISNYEVVTAAHCVDTNFIGTSFVYFGDNARKSRRTLNVNAFPIVKIQISKLRKGRVGREAIVGDVAIVTLAQPISEIDKARPGVHFRPLPMMEASDYSQLKQNDGILIAGFGFTEFRELGTLYETFMMYRYLSDSNQFIFVQAYSATTGRFCYGDSGGPAYFIVNGEWKIAGVISHIVTGSPQPGHDPSSLFNCTLGNEKISTFIGHHFQ